MQGYGVPTDVDLVDLDGITHTWQIVYPIIEWSAVDEKQEHVNPDDPDDIHVHLSELWFPAVLDPTPFSGVAPASTYFGPMMVFDTRRSAMAFARAMLNNLRKQREDLEKGLTDLTSEALSEPDFDK